MRLLRWDAILDSAECNFHPNILHLQKSKKCIIRHQCFTAGKIKGAILEEEIKF
jgi:hypothetical protein